MVECVVVGHREHLLGLKVAHWVAIMVVYMMHRWKFTAMAAAITITTLHLTSRLAMPTARADFQREIV